MQNFRLNLVKNIDNIESSALSGAGHGVDIHNGDIDSTRKKDIDLSRKEEQLAHALM